MYKLYLRNNTCPHVEIIRYPDGQKNIKLEARYFDLKRFPVEIVCSIKTFDELEILFALCAALKKEDLVVTTLDFKYLFGLRSDRAFETGMPNYFVDVVAPIINLLPGQKQFMDPHNIMMINNYIKDSQPYSYSVTRFLNQNFMVVGGDQSYGTNTFYKRRQNGEVIVRLPRVVEELLIEAPDKVILVKDDLCDGGATFVEEGKILREKFPNRKICLEVTHGLFTKGFSELAKYYNTIYTTNSYQEIDQPGLVIQEDVFKC
jgi:ribose-phosphate pyrophosphokinase